MTDIPEIFHVYAESLTALQKEALLGVKSKGPFHKSSYGSAYIWGRIKECWVRYRYAGMIQLTAFGRRVQEILREKAEKSNMMKDSPQSS